jgi:hypothetical protein
MNKDFNAKLVLFDTCSVNIYEFEIRRYEFGLTELILIRFGYNQV